MNSTSQTEPLFFLGSCWLRGSSRGIAGRTYWICAFAVNQHAGICENSGGDRDSWTGQVLKAMESGSDFAVLSELYLGEPVDL